MHAVALAVIVSAAMTAAATVQAATLSVAAVEDAFIKSDATSNGNGAYPTMCLSAEPSRERDWRGLLRFDLSGIPSGATVTSAAVSLTQVHGATSLPDANYGLYRVTTAWTQGSNAVKNGNGGYETGGCNGNVELSGATWLETGVAQAAWSTPGGDFDATARATAVVPDAYSTTTWTSAELAADVQAWVNGGANNGWLLKQADAAAESNKIFATSEWADPAENAAQHAAKRPTLVVEYTEPVEPGALPTCDPTRSVASGATTTIKYDRTNDRFLSTRCLVAPGAPANSCDNRAHDTVVGGTAYWIVSPVAGGYGHEACEEAAP
uniref:Carbohydrate-binding module family 96 domain-containing protein n=2 Tax=Bicosoecida sp. CB-2014 TaxID=1486930 RepID=A0A7S1CN71_9STRA|mmetsp:Transcript_7045/g.25056  ORF Transcript_7045/g.25056 Transcript_7045/m.25056 type:complete len:323 (+) Transcript_7045:133-1101(+)